MQSWMFWFKAVKWIYKSIFLLHDILDFLLSCQIIQSYQICSFQIKFCHLKKYFLSWRKKTNSLGPFKFWKELFTLLKLVGYKVVTAEHSGRMKAIVHYYSDADVYEFIQVWHKAIMEPRESGLFVMAHETILLSMPCQAYTLNRYIKNLVQHKVTIVEH